MVGGNANFSGEIIGRISGKRNDIGRRPVSEDLHVELPHGCPVEECHGNLTPGNFSPGKLVEDKKNTADLIGMKQ
jgi:hypothetical protein